MNTQDGAHVDDKIVKLVGVPSYLVYGAIALIVVLSGGPVGQLVMVSHHVYALQSRVADAEREIAAGKVRQDDILIAIKVMSSDIKDLTKSVAILNSKMP